MHELGIVMEIVRVVEDMSKEQGFDSVDSVVLQIGELSPVVPQYVEECWPAAIDGTFMDASVYFCDGDFNKWQDTVRTCAADDGKKNGDRRFRLRGDSPPRYQRGENARGDNGGAESLQSANS